LFAFFFLIWFDLLTRVVRCAFRTLDHSDAVEHHLGWAEHSKQDKSVVVRNKETVARVKCAYVWHYDCMYVFSFIVVCFLFHFLLIISLSFVFGFQDAEIDTWSPHSFPSLCFGNWTIHLFCELLLLFWIIILIDFENILFSQKCKVYFSNEIYKNEIIYVDWDAFKNAVAAQKRSWNVGGIYHLTASVVLFRVVSHQFFSFFEFFSEISFEFLNDFSCV